LTFAFQLLYLLALGLIKSSILCFYTRVFVSTRTLLAVKGMFGVVATWAVAHALAVIFICTPVSFQWDLTIIGGKCGDQIKLFQSIITSNIITDVMIMLLPIYSTYPAYLFANKLLAYNKNSCMALENANDRESGCDGVLSDRNPVRCQFCTEPHIPALTSVVASSQPFCA
jgi:hypothetical protein